MKSEEAKDTVLLESKIIKEDLYQIQQNTLIVWQELDGTDVALSFQEEDGCLEIWNFLRHVQKLLNGQQWEGPEDSRSTNKGDDDVSDDEGESNPNDPVFLPEPTLAKLAEVEELVHHAMLTVARRESLAKFVLGENYVPKLIASLETAEDMESVADLHRLCNIIKALILLNDAAVFECILKEDVFFGVAGILEYDVDFPNHKAEHRKFLSDGSKFKEVVEVKDPEIKQKIHQTFRLQYLKDVVLARILDDPTFSILNTLIFFNQVDIVSHFQHNEDFLNDLFGIFDASDNDRKSDAVLFIQQFTSIAKTLQPPARVALYKAFIEHGLFKVLVYALGPEAPSNVRLSGADIITAIIDHDPKLLRGFVIEQNMQNQVTLCETLIRLLISQPDLGTKSQIAEALRLLLDPTAGPPLEGGPQPQTRRKEDPDSEKFLEMFYARDVQVLMAPLLTADFSETTQLDFEQIALYTHLCDLLCFFIRAHTFRSKFFVLSQNISIAISRIFLTSEKHLHLSALRYFRVCIGMNDEFYNRHMIKNSLFAPIIKLTTNVNRRDNLINSASLEFFESIRRENLKGIVYHLVENYREKMEASRIDVFRNLINRYEQYQEAAATPVSDEKLKDVRPDTLSVVPSKRPLIDSEYDDEDPRDKENRPEVDAAEADKIAEVGATIDDKVGEKRRRSLEEEEGGPLERMSKVQTTPEKKSNGSPGSVGSSLKKKMMSTFGRKEK